jgi:hypothetical protein
MGSAAAGPTYGVLVGVNIANFHGSDVSGTDSRTGFIGGVTGTFRLSHVFGIQPELLFEQKGAAADFVGVDETGNLVGVDGTFKLNYLEIPVLARVEFTPESGAVRPFLLAGPSVAVRIGCSLAGSAQGVSASVGCNDVLGDEAVSSVDFGAAVGGGLDILMGTWDLSLGVRYDHGLESVLDGSNMKNKAISVLAGVTF